MIEKTLYGKLSIKTYHSEGKIIKNTKFNIINLNIEDGELLTALNKWQNY
jgi:hypothetical protein